MEEELTLSKRRHAVHGRARPGDRAGEHRGTGGGAPGEDLDVVPDAVVLVVELEVDRRPLWTLNTFVENPDAAAPEGAASVTLNASASSFGGPTTAIAMPPASIAMPAVAPTNRRGRPRSRASATRRTPRRRSPRQPRRARWPSRRSASATAAPARTGTGSRRSRRAPDRDQDRQQEALLLTFLAHRPIPVRISPTSRNRARPSPPWSPLRPTGRRSPRSSPTGSRRPRASSRARRSSGR